MKIEKKYSNGGCMKTAAILIILIWLCVNVIGCATQKEGCGSYDKWVSKTKFTK